MQQVVFNYLIGVKIEKCECDFGDLFNGYDYPSTSHPSRIT